MTEGCGRQKMTEEQAMNNCFTSSSSTGTDNITPDEAALLSQLPTLANRRRPVQGHGG